MRHYMYYVVCRYNVHVYAILVNTEAVHTDMKIFVSHAIYLYFYRHHLLCWIFSVTFWYGIPTKESELENS